MWNTGNFSNQQWSNKVKTIRYPKVFASVHNLSKQRYDSRKGVSPCPHPQDFSQMKKQFLNKCNGMTSLTRMSQGWLVWSVIRMCQLSQFSSVRRDITYLGLVTATLSNLWGSSLFAPNKTVRVFCYPLPLLPPFTVFWRSCFCSCMC